MDTTSWWTGTGFRERKQLCLADWVMGAFTLRQSRGGVDLWVKMLSFYAVLRRVSLWSWVGAVVTNVILA